MSRRARPRSSMDRVPDFESVGWAFESPRGRLYVAVLRTATPIYGGFDTNRIYEDPSPVQFRCRCGCWLQSYLMMMLIRLQFY